MKKENEADVKIYSIALLRLTIKDCICSFYYKYHANSTFIRIVCRFNATDVTSVPSFGKEQVVDSYTTGALPSCFIVERKLLRDSFDGQNGWYKQNPVYSHTVQRYIT